MYDKTWRRGLAIQSGSTPPAVPALHTRRYVRNFSAGLSGPLNSEASTLTADGIDVVFGVNFVGHFALTVELMPLIQSTHAARCETEKPRVCLEGGLASGYFALLLGVWRKAWDRFRSCVVHF